MSMFDTHKAVGLKRPIPSSPDTVKRHTIHKTIHSSLDILEHAPGEFDWASQADLTAWVLSGHAEVVLDDGRAMCLRPGNALFLPRGLHGRWIVKESLRTAVVFND